MNGLLIFSMVLYALVVVCAMVSDIGFVGAVCVLASSAAIVGAVWTVSM